MDICLNGGRVDVFCYDWSLKTSAQCSEAAQPSGAYTQDWLVDLLVDCVNHPGADRMCLENTSSRTPVLSRASTTKTSGHPWPHGARVGPNLGSLFNLFEPRQVSDTPMNK